MAAQPQCVGSFAFISLDLLDFSFYLLMRNIFFINSPFNMLLSLYSPNNCISLQDLGCGLCYSSTFYIIYSPCYITIDPEPVQQKQHVLIPHSLILICCSMKKYFHVNIFYDDWSVIWRPQLSSFSCSFIMTFTVWYWGIGRQGPGHDCSSLDWNVKRNVVSIKTETPSTSCCCPLLPPLQSPSCLNFSSPFLFLSPHYFGNYTEKWDIDNITSDGVEKIIKAKREKWKS